MCEWGVGESCGCDPSRVPCPTHTRVDPLSHVFFVFVSFFVFVCLHTPCRQHGAGHIM